MADSRFFVYMGGKTLAEIAVHLGLELPKEVNPQHIIADVAPLNTADHTHLSFLDNPKYRPDFAASKAGVCIVHTTEKTLAPAGMILLRSNHPYKSYALAAQLFYQDHAPTAEVHPRAMVAASATIGDGCSIAANATIEEDVVMGAHCHIGAGAVIGRGVILGDDCIIGANAVITHAILHNRVVIYAGACIGQAGFGFAPDGNKPVKVPQLGRVIIEDDVEVGANSTIDRGAGPDTVIGAGTMIDNQVQIAHNVVLGRGCILAAQVGISGSTRVGDFVMMGGKAGLTGHLTVGSGARIAAGSGVMRDVAAGEAVGGAPAFPMREWMRQQAALKRLSQTSRHQEG